MSKQIENVRKKQGYCIVFIATPVHGNLGDHAIVYSQERFFTDRGLGKNIVEIPSPKYQIYASEIKKYITDKDLIVIDGGGSMGTLWLNEEHKMQHIVKNFPYNPIFIFPQTVFYSDDVQGKTESQQAAEVYSAHRNLHICAREKASYLMMKKLYPTVDILLVPDMALYLNHINYKQPRKGAILCLRTDKEKQLDKEIIKQIYIDLELRGLKIKNESTVISETILKRKRLQKLKKKWNSFSRAQIIITDRLHGMIFAAITGTPCLAFDNSSGKVSNVYDWIKNLPYIRFANKNVSIKHTIDSLLICDNYSYNNIMLRSYYNKLYDVIKLSLNS
ncbi:polysaccharide pyruvyl transferase family protein [Syntrophus gentianae]|uniref:polysaccharide pyruvyl transferase family protein n=1 Tax=Syntrophus gentianae TaxID=43775 RepID=UPI0015879DBC|nr:polysaccharide pyruvyl transferase family protein [Syntrophus gentianae]